MSVLGNSKQAAVGIANNISKQQSAIASQISQFDALARSIEAVMGGTASGADTKIVGILSQASQKAKKAQAELVQAASRLEKWASES